jgi:polar amino acid transport system permease protein
MLTSRQRTRIIRNGIYIATLTLLGWLASATDWLKLQENFFDPRIFLSLFPEILWRAARNTLIFTAFGFSGGLAIGLLLALMRLSTVAPYRWAAAIYIEVFRGLPALVTIVLIGFALPIAL